MFLPVEGMETSSLLGKYKITGNTVISEEIKNKTYEYAKDKMKLYDTQKEIEKYLCEKYTKEWYDENDYECQFIVEEIYNEIERNETSTHFINNHAGIFY
ncbi:MAG: hypothetical protein PHY47_26515 [Lachnospiraceae bacterium]|nr:hypothetical protein [Lachnospiraceae bacterium]